VRLKEQVKPVNIALSDDFLHGMLKGAAIICVDFRLKSFK
jgi:hypothetical protein